MMYIYIYSYICIAVGVIMPVELSKSSQLASQQPPDPTKA